MKKKRKYTKTAKWHAAHSPKALKARKVVKLVRPAIPEPTFKVGDLVQPHLLPSRAGTILTVKRWVNTYVYRLSTNVTYNEHQLEIADRSPASQQDWVNFANTNGGNDKVIKLVREQMQGLIHDRDLQIGVLKDQLHEAETKMEQLRRSLEAETKDRVRCQEYVNQTHDSVDKMSKKIVRLQNIVNAFIEGKF